MATAPERPALRERYDRRRDEVVATCARVFAERGYHATSIDDLVEATELTRGGLYHYIGSKGELLFRIFDELMEPLLVRAREIVAADAPAEERLRELTRVWVRHVESHLDHMVVFSQERRIVESGPQWEDVRADRAEFESMLAAVLEDGVRDGSFAVADPALTTLAFLGMVNYTPGWFDPAGRLTADEIAAGFCDTLLAGIRAF